MNCGYVIKIEKLLPHPNADKLQILQIGDIQTIVGLNCKVGDIGVYFQECLKLSPEFCDYNHLCRQTQGGEPDIGYMDPKKRNVTAIKLRGQASCGIYLPISCLGYLNVDLKSFKPGDIVEIINGQRICEKYIPYQKPVKQGSLKQVLNKKHKENIAPYFLQHVDTEQLAYHLEDFHPGDNIEITLKIHGTSHRVAYTPVLKKHRRSIIDCILHKDGKPVYNWEYIAGTRRTILENYEGGYYGNNQFREPHSKIFEGKLLKGETVYLEICGFTQDGIPIMPSADNNILQDKEFITKYGESTVFSYGCKPNGKQLLWGKDNEEIFSIEENKPQSDCYVYRITYTTSEGAVIEYSPEQMRQRCAEIGVKTVPVLYRGYIPEDVENAGEYVLKLAEFFNDDVDPIGKTHIREGCVIRIINRPKFSAYKSKNNTFKILTMKALDLLDANKYSKDMLGEM